MITTPWSLRRYTRRNSRWTFGSRRMDEHSQQPRKTCIALLAIALLAATPSHAYAGGPPPIVGWILLGMLVAGTALVSMLVGAIAGGITCSIATRKKYPELTGKQYFLRWALSFIVRSNVIAFRSFMVLLALWAGLFAGGILYWFWIDFVCKQ